MLQAQENTVQNRREIIVQTKWDASGYNQFWLNYNFINLITMVGNGVDGLRRERRIGGYRCLLANMAFQQENCHCIT